VQLLFNDERYDCHLPLSKDKKRQPAMNGLKRLRLNAFAMFIAASCILSGNVRALVLIAIKIFCIS